MPGPRRLPNGYRGTVSARGRYAFQRPAKSGRSCVFDSGIGGLTVLKELVAVLPREHFNSGLGDNRDSLTGTKNPTKLIIKIFAL